MRWEIPPRVWAFLVSLAGAVLALAVVAGIAQWRNQRDTERELQELREAVCGVTEIIGGGPTPQSGPEGERARSIIARMRALERAACDHRDN